MSTTYEERQRKLEDALREGFVARRDNQPRDTNAYDRPALRKAAERLMHDADDSKKARAYNAGEQAAWVEERYTHGRCGTRSCWFEGWDMADGIAAAQGEERLMNFPLQTIRPKRAAEPRFADPHHVSMFTDEEVPFVKVSRADREYRDRQRLALLEGRTLAPQLADEQP